MAKRKIPRLAYGEYVSSDPKHSDDVWHARRRMIEIVRRVHPIFFQRLMADVFPIFNQITEAGFHLDPLNPYARLKNQHELKNAILKWATEFNAGADWLFDDVLRTLSYWLNNPEARVSLKWTPLRGVVNLAAVNPGAFDFCYEPWDVQRVRWASYIKSLRERFEKAISEYETKTREVAESQGLVRARRQYNPANLEWFVRYQFAGMSSKKIADRLAAEDKGRVPDDSSVLKGVKAAARLIGWDNLRNQD